MGYFTISTDELFLPSTVFFPDPFGHPSCHQVAPAFPWFASRPLPWLIGFSPSLRHHNQTWLSWELVYNWELDTLLTHRCFMGWIYCKWIYQIWIKIIIVQVDNVDVPLVISWDTGCPKDHVRSLHAVKVIPPHPRIGVCHFKKNWLPACWCGIPLKDTGIW